jgi:hypothetical protein
MRVKLIKARFLWTMRLIHELTHLLKKEYKEDYISFPYSSNSNSNFNVNNIDKENKLFSLTRPFKTPFRNLRLILPFITNSNSSTGTFPQIYTETLTGKILKANSNETITLENGNLTFSPLLNFDLTARNSLSLKDVFIKINSTATNFDVSLNSNFMDGFLHQKVPSKQPVRIESDQDIFLSDVFNNIVVKTNIGHEINVLVIYVDALSNPHFISQNFLSEFMPNTDRFFRTSLKFNNHFAAAEWTTPGFTSLVSGKYSYEHDRVFSNSQIKSLGLPLEELPDTVFTDFNKRGFFTSYIGGITHLNPKFGYSKDVSRYLYMPNATASELITTFLEQDTSFKPRNAFNWISFMDAHESKHLNPKERRNANALLRNFDHPYLENDMTFLGLNKAEFQDYAIRIFDLDAQLEVLYRYLDSINDGNQIICLVSDHGGAAMKNRQSEILNDERVRIPLYVKSSYISETDVKVYTSNVDFRSILQSLLKEQKKEISDFLIQPSSENFLLVESRYIGKRYSCRVIDRKNGNSVYLEGGNVNHLGSVDLSEVRIKSITGDLDVYSAIKWVNSKLTDSAKFFNSINC